MKLYRSLILCLLTTYSLYSEKVNPVDADHNMISSNLLKNENIADKKNYKIYSASDMIELIYSTGYCYYGVGFTSPSFSDCEPIGTINIGCRIYDTSSENKSHLGYDLSSQLSFKSKLIYDYVEQYPLKFTFIQYLSPSSKSSLYIGQSLSWAYFYPNIDHYNNYKMDLFEGFVYGLRFGYQLGMGTKKESSIDLDINCINPELHIDEAFEEKLNKKTFTKLKDKTYSISLIYNTSF